MAAAAATAGAVATAATDTATVAGVNRMYTLWRSLEFIDEHTDDAKVVQRDGGSGDAHSD